MSPSLDQWPLRRSTTTHVRLRALAWIALCALAVIACHERVQEQLSNKQHSTVQIADSARGKRIGKSPMEAVTPHEGFEYFTGWLDTGLGELSWDFPTIYLYQDQGQPPTLKLIGRGINLDFPISDIDAALQAYKLVVQQRAKGMPERAMTDEQMLDFLEKAEKQFQRSYPTGESRR